MIVWKLSTLSDIFYFYPSDMRHPAIMCNIAEDHS